MFKKTASIDIARSEYLAKAREYYGYTESAIADNSQGKNYHKKVVANCILNDGTFGYVEMCDILFPGSTSFVDLRPSRVIIVAFEFLWTNLDGSNRSSGWLYAPDGYYFTSIGVEWNGANAAIPLYTEAPRVDE